MQAPSRRQNWMSTLAKADLGDLEQRVIALGALPSYNFLRAPETGLVMVQGKAGGTGQPFYLGEMTMTRCVVQVQPEEEGNQAIVGFGYIAGRSHRHAELAAVCDALLQHSDWFDTVQTSIIMALQTIAQQRQVQQQGQVEATQVNFFTMVRGQSE